MTNAVIPASFSIALSVVACRNSIVVAPLFRRYRFVSYTLIV
jgi:hypothetical protein